jgi:hypothetical protein
MADFFLKFLLEHCWFFVGTQNFCWNTFILFCQLEQSIKFVPTKAKIK